VSEFGLTDLECAAKRIYEQEAQLVTMHKLLTQAVVAWKQGHWNSLLDEQQLYLSKAWFKAAREAVYLGWIEQLRDELNINGDLIQEVKDREAEIEQLRSVIDSLLHERRCVECDTVFYAADGVVPYCLCPQCNSQDTRRLKADKGGGG